jgi:3-hydroxyisobutyrate dehydrogenase
MTENKGAQDLRVGFVGLGDMGQQMALNLASRGWALSVHDLRPSRAEPFRAYDTSIAESARDVAAASDVLCICVLNARQVEDVLFGPRGAAEALRRDAIVVDHSTIGASHCRDISARLSPLGVHYVDAPVSGAALRAGQGDLTIAVGGDPEVVERCMPLLNAEGSTVVHLGPTGSGQIAKLVNNGLFATQVSFIDEAIRLGEAMGLDAKQLWSVIDSGATGSWASGYYGRQVELAGGKRDPASVFGRAPDPEGALKIITKDVALFVEQLQASGLGASRMAATAAGAIDAIGAPLPRG